MKKSLLVMAAASSILTLPALAQDWESLRNQAEQDPQALAQLQHAAQHGHGEAAFYLGTLYAPPICKQERTVRKSWNRALHWYRVAADWGEGKADFDLGLAYEKGLGVAEDPTLARYYYRRMMTQAAREVGVPAAQAEVLGTGEAYPAPPGDSAS